MNYDGGQTGSLKEAVITKETEYLWVLKAIKDISFPVGKNLLIDFMIGATDNKSVIGCHLDTKECFGCLAYTKEELDGMINRLLLNGLIVQVPSRKNKFWKVLEITKKGEEELIEPTLNKKNTVAVVEHRTVITEQERAVFQAFGKVLERYNDEQKKAIISKAKQILCIAGAGSGKTTVLTKRIEFLIRYKLVDPDKILAITFTRKARQEMEKRLSENNVYGVNIQTFNSFCEGILRQNGDRIYGREMRVISFKDKIQLINRALTHLGTNIYAAINSYFTPQQRRGKRKEQLLNIFRSDCFFIRDYLKFKGEKIEDIGLDGLDYSHKRNAELIFGICKYLDEYMRQAGLRDFADQLIDTIAFFKRSPLDIPNYDHVLVDEFQDINPTQIELIDLINPDNIFCVGDPRQSIYGWRGSDIKYILNFKEKYPDAEIIGLTKNYRSNEHIVKLFNESIKTMQLADLESTLPGEKDIQLLNFKKQESEFSFIAERILSSDTPRNEIFVLARTNRLLNRMSDHLRSRQIKHVLRSDETGNKKVVNTDKTKITLATIHAIKGLEAEMVFVMGCNTNSFPCRTSEHPVIDLVKIDEYDKEEEERRLFYVAISRAKNHLYMTHTGAASYFISAGMRKLLGSDWTEETSRVSPETKTWTKTKKKKFKAAKFKSNNTEVVARLKDWRLALSQKTGLPAFMILHNSTLEAIANSLPMTLADLEEIPGMGPVKIQKYGEEILAQII